VTQGLVDPTTERVRAFREMERDGPGQRRNLLGPRADRPTRA
jgi:hypothetical protein